MKFIEKLLESLVMNIKNSLAYVSEVWSSIIVSMIEIIIYYYIWMAVFSENTVLNGISKTQIVTYIILARIIYMHMGWGINLYVSELIQTGQVSMRLLIPMDFQLSMLMGRLGDFIAFTFTQSIPSFVIMALFIGVTFPPSIAFTLLFLLSLLLAIAISFFIDFGVGIISFYTNNGWGMQMVKYSVMSFFSGAIVPITFFPNWLKKASDFLPFKQLVYDPISIYLGLVSGHELIQVLLRQVFWIVLLFILTRIFYNIAIKKVTVQGG